MKIKCEECESEDWKIVIHSVTGRGLNAIYSALKCTKCGMVYPLEKLVVLPQPGITTESVKDYLRTSIYQVE
jgi:uncharacterized Zn finger protein